uniref:ATP-grasp domain-containing protein n=1 Tax=viral metagenome TaxID=1070528 RepID=A0A6C0CDU7_9ZZZZ
MKIGFIVGKNNEICDDKDLKKITPKKFLADTFYKKNQLHIDVAIAMSVKTKFPGHQVDIILPKEISLQRLKKNDINFVLGYDYISTIEEDPWVPKFAGEKGQNLLIDIYKNPDSKVFPPFKHQEFIWNKKKYLTKFKNSKIPINPTIFVKGSVNIPKLLAQISNYKWTKFIVKPIGGCEGHGCSFFITKDIIAEPTKLVSYFIEQSDFYEEFLVQRLTEGFKKYGEVKSFWLGGEYSYAIVTKDVAWSDSIVTPLTDKKILEKCLELGSKVNKAIPKLEFNGRKTDPVMTRVDMVCCLDNKPLSSYDYYLNEIEEGGLAGSYTDFKQITFPFVEVLSDAYVRKARELLE